MNTVELIRHVSHRKLHTLCQLDHKWFFNLWSSDTIEVPQNIGWLIFDVESTSIPVNLPLEVVVNDEIAATFVLFKASPVMFLQPGDKLQVRLRAYKHEYGEKKIIAGNVKIIGWEIDNLNQISM